MAGANKHPQQPHTHKGHLANPQRRPVTFSSVKKAKIIGNKPLPKPKKPGLF